MMAIVKRLLTNVRAQDLAEYGIAVAVIGLGASIVGFVISGKVDTLWSNANGIIAIAAS